MSVANRRRRARLPERALAEATSATLVAAGYEEPKRDDGLYAPRPRGNLEEALKDAETMARVVPETPRPVEMLEGVTASGGSMLTAQDLALHELLVAAAYEAALAASKIGYEVEVVGRELTISMLALTRFLGPSVRRSHVIKSLDALLAIARQSGWDQRDNLDERSGAAAI